MSCLQWHDKIKNETQRFIEFSLVSQKKSLGFKKSFCQWNFCDGLISISSFYLAFFLFTCKTIAHETLVDDEIMNETCVVFEKQAKIFWTAWPEFRVWVIPTSRLLPINALMLVSSSWMKNSILKLLEIIQTHLNVFQSLQIQFFQSVKHFNSSWWLKMVSWAWKKREKWERKTK